MYKTLPFLKDVKVAYEQKVQYLLDMNHYQLDENHAVIELPGLKGERGIICHRSGLVANYSLIPVEGLADRLAGECDIRDKHYYLYRVVKVNKKTSPYRWCRIGWTNIWAAEHQLVSIAFGLWDNITDLSGMDVCHRIAVQEGYCNNSVENLFVDTHRFNSACARLEQAIRYYGYTAPISLDRTTFDKWCDNLKTLAKAETWARQ